MPLRITLLLLALQAVVVLAGPEPAATPPTWDAKPEVAGILANVPPLKHPFPEGWQPTLFWWQAPLSFDNPVLLKAELTGLAARGIQPCIQLAADYEDFWAYPATPASVARVIAEAKAVAAAGFPVNIQMCGILGLYTLPGGPKGKVVRHPDAPSTDKKDAVGNLLPCLILQEGWRARAAHLRGVLQKLADAKVPVATVWYDYEDHPHPWNGIMEHCQACPGCRKEFPAGVLDGPEQFIAWTFNWRDQALAEGLSKPVREVFPAARIGHYSYAPSSAANPRVDGDGLRYPLTKVNPAEIDAVQPVCYAETRFLRRHFNADWAIPQRQVEQVYLSSLLASVSGLVRNIRSNQILVPFVSGWVAAGVDDPLPRLSRSLYREFLRHAVLRGARGFYCFNFAGPSSIMPTYYTELADINVVYNELFAYRDFLEGGETLNHEWPAPKLGHAVVWSGLRKGNRALIRAVAMGDASRTVDVVPFPGVAVKLVAQPAGMTYLVESTGKVQTLE